MRNVVRISEGDSKYEDMVKRAKEAVVRSDNAFIVAKGNSGKKEGIKPLCVAHGISFYIAHKMQDALIYSPNNDSETIKAAITNTISSTRICSLESAIGGFIGGNISGTSCFDLDAWIPGDDGLYVLTNSEGMNGSGILFCAEVLKKIWEKIGNYYLIPSSVHEILIAPDKHGLKKEDFDAMVQEVNRKEVPDEEQLIDRAFYFDGALN